MKKLLAIVLAVAMVMALSVSVFAEDVVYTMETTEGQGMESLALADGAVFSTGDNGDSYARIATNWVNGGSIYSQLISLVQTEGAVLRLTYTGTITVVGFQTENGGYELTNVTDITEVDGKNVAIIPCADIVANAPVAIANDNVGWGNFMVDYTEGGALYGFEIVTGYEAPAAEEPAAEEPAAEEPAAEEPAAEEPAAEEPAAPAETPAPATGLALAVVPAVIALAAVAVSKKH